MKPTRRDTLQLALGSAGALALSPGADAAGQHCGAPQALRWAPGVEGQRRADLGNGTYLNPVLAGDRPDPNIFKDGKDYYATFSSFYYYPAVPIWHSRDLVNWTPLTAALKTYIGSVWALDIAKHDGRYFIYIPTFDPAAGARMFKTWVIHAASMAGPWSEPIDLKLDGHIDPGHVVGEDGKRYLFLNAGDRVRLADDGLSIDGPVEHVYDGWPIPESWIVEGFALEGPKLLKKDGWFYYFSGEGGTAGPPTSHMVVVARSRSIHGPWENCPHNPIVRTANRHEPWWSRGHATPVEGPDGRWWLVYHGYENGFRTLGRQMLLEPFTWTADGWPKALGGDLSRPLRKPSPAPARHGVALSGFNADMFMTKFGFYAPRGDYLGRARLAGDTLTLAAQGKDPADTSPLLFVAGDRAYEVTVEIDADPATEAGLLLFYDEKLYCGLGIRDGYPVGYRVGQREREMQKRSPVGRRQFLRVVNDENVASFYRSDDGIRWVKTGSYEVSCYNHNIGDGFLSLRPGLYAAGAGEVRFRCLFYRAFKGGA